LQVFFKKIQLKRPAYPETGLGDKSPGSIESGLGAKNKTDPTI